MKRNSNSYTISALAALLLFAACNVTKQYKRPQMDIPENYRGNPVAVTSDTLHLSWKDFVKEPDLIKLVERAIERNSDVSVAMLNMRQLELSYKQSKNELLPSADFNMGASRSWPSSNSLNGSLSEQFIGTRYMDDYSATIRISWEADIWRKANMQKTVARSHFFSQKENLAALRTRIVVQVIQAYYNLLALDEQLRTAQKNLALSDSTLAMLVLQYNSAQVSSLAVGQAEAQKKTAELLIPLANQQIAIQENALGILCGDFPSAIERPKRFDTLLIETAFPTGVPAGLLSRRPDVKAAEYALIASNSKTGLAKVAMYPSLSLTPSFGLNSFKLNNWFSLPGSMMTSLAANLVQPIFQKRALKTGYEIAKLEQEKTLIHFKQSLMTAVSEVSDALARINYSEERLILIESKTQSLRKATSDAMLLYTSGMANYLEVITAQNNALQNELEYISIKRDKVNAITDLYRSLGGE